MKSFHDIRPRWAIYYFTSNVGMRTHVSSSRNACSPEPDWSIVIYSHRLILALWGERIMPDVSRTEIGRRMFILNKEKHAEVAVEKIRRRLGADWGSISMEEISLLRKILGEAWVYTDRAIWDKIAFSDISIADLYQIVGIGRNIRERNIAVQTGMDEIIAILQRHT